MSDYPEDQASRGFGGGGSSRGFLGDTLKHLKQKYVSPQGQGQSQYSSGYQSSPNQQPPYGHGRPSSGHGYNPDLAYGDVPGPHKHGNKPKTDLIGGLLSGDLLSKAQSFGNDVAGKLGAKLDPEAYAQYDSRPSSSTNRNRYDSFAPMREFSDAKWYVDGCSYFWAVSRALENARDSIWILDWWLSPELYLRRPPSQNEQYRLDRMLQAAAQRGVRVNVIVYKEVPPTLSLDSEHTKHSLESLHPNIAVFRHPDHEFTKADLHQDLAQGFKNMKLDDAGISQLPQDIVKSIYGTHNDVILYWSHHEKLCIIDGRIAFMGGLDLCFGRWDTWQHSIADAHPSGGDQAVLIPGQDYNNSRISDFHDVAHWQNQPLNRNISSRMGWSDCSISLHGSIVQDLRKHFVDRWNYIFGEKYEAKNQSHRYAPLQLYSRSRPSATPGQQLQSQPQPPSQQSQQQQQHNYQQQGQSGLPSGNGPPQWQSSAPQSPPTFNPPGSSTQSPYSQNQYKQGQSSSQAYTYSPQQQGPFHHPSNLPSKPHQDTQQYQSSWGSNPSFSQYAPPDSGQYGQPPENFQESYQPHQPYQQYQSYQSLTPNQSESSATRGFEEPPFGGHGGYGHGETEYSRSLGQLRSDAFGFGKLLKSQLAGQVHHYQDRYLSGPPGQMFKPKNSPMMIQLTRSASPWSSGISLEHSIQNAYCQLIRDSEHFIYIENQFFVTATSNMQKPVENTIGAALVERIIRAARAGQKYHVIVVIPSVPAFPGDLKSDSALGTRAIMKYQYAGINRGNGHSIMELIAKEGYNPMDFIRFYNLRNYDRINATSGMIKSDKQGQPSDYTNAGSSWDSVTSCYMLGGQDIRQVPWDHPDVPEIDAFVSEELYIHTKVMIVDDRTVVIGSANINDRSQLGSRDSEIAVVIQDPTPIESRMNGQPWPVSRFATTLRRQLNRKHLGLLRPQDFTRPTANFEPIGVAPNDYEFGSPEDAIVSDPLADTFLSLWNSRAHTNTLVYRKVFHAVPDDTVQTWADYEEYFEYDFHGAAKEATDTSKPGLLSPGAKYEWGHVVKDEFPGGVAQVKEELAKVRGMLVEMPLMFLIREDMAKAGVTLNPITEPIYT